MRVSQRYSLSKSNRISLKVPSISTKTVLWTRDTSVHITSLEVSLVTSRFKLMSSPCLNPLLSVSALNSNLPDPKQGQRVSRESCSITASWNHRENQAINVIHLCQINFWQHHSRVHKIQTLLRSFVIDNVNTLPRDLSVKYDWGMCYYTNPWSLVTKKNVNYFWSPENLT